MIPRGGIDSQIEQRKMQFGANPQALQQRYGQSKQLLDLLALQQIAAEQQQKSQAMALQMQQNPATVADQLEQEVIQGKKAEMAQSLQGMQAMRAPKRSQSDTARGVAGALAQKQREQQSRMQKMAGSGIAGQPARNMERMYNGGIVGFAGENGSYIPTEEEIDAAIRDNPKLAVLPRDSVRNIVAKQIARKTAEEESVEGLRKRAAANPFARRLMRSQQETDQEEKAEPKPFSERGVTLGAEKEKLGLPGEDLASLLPDDMQGLQGELDKVQTAQAKRQAFEDYQAPADLEAILEEAAGGYGRAPQQAQAAPGMDAQSILSRVKGTTSAQAPATPAATTPAGQPPGGIAGLPAATTPAAAAAEPSMQEQILKEMMLSGKQEQEDLAAARKALEAQYSGRGKGTKFLDRLIAASQKLGDGRPATSNRQALSRLLGGYASAAGAEKEAEKQGLEKLAERQRQLTQGQLGLATGLAGIRRGEEMTGLEGRRVAELETAGAAGRKLSIEQLEENKKQFKESTAQRAREFEQSLGMQAEQLAANMSSNAESRRIQENYNKALVAIREAEQRLKEEGDPSDYINALTTYESSVNKYIGQLVNASFGDQDRIAELQALGAQLIRNRRAMISKMAKDKNVTFPEDTSPSPGGDSTLTQEVQETLNKYQ